MSQYISGRQVTAVEMLISDCCNCKKPTNVVHCRNPIKLIFPLLSQISGRAGLNVQFRISMQHQK